MPKPKDIGIIFDVTVENLSEEYEELLVFSIRANGFCCVNVTPDMVMQKMGRIVGGDFGPIEPGTIKQVSLIWPTASLYNRVGLCPIAISSTNINNEKSTSKQIIKFDTRFQILYPYNQTLRKQIDFVDCQNFRNCTPVDCKDRYFHLRNFCNTTLEKCGECAEKYQLYTSYSNKSICGRIILSENDIKRFEGKFKNDVREFKSNVKKDQLHKTSNPSNDKFNVPLEQAIVGKWLLKANENKGYGWMFGLGEGLLIVFVTITIYLLICFSIFLFVTWLSRRSKRGGDASGRDIILTSHQLGLSEETIPLYTTCSLMSHR